jgi:hypothetical protein
VKSPQNLRKMGSTPSLKLHGEELKGLKYPSHNINNKLRGPELKHPNTHHTP